LKNGTSLAALIAVLLNIINEIVAMPQDLIHSVIALVLAIATIVAIWKIDYDNGGRGRGPRPR
jgi:hypothetical protein